MEERGLMLTPDLRAKSRAGDKTNTRRVIKPQPVYRHRGMFINKSERDKWAFETGVNGSIKMPIDHSEVKEKMAQYQVGDLLYLQEPYQIQSPGIHPGDNHTGRVMYVDDCEFADIQLTEAEWKLWYDRKKQYMKTASRFMYKSLARTWFKVTGVKAERVQDISDEDAKAEGVSVLPLQDADDKSAWWQTAPGVNQARTPKASFCKLWDSVAKPGFKWADNPFVFVYVYERIER